MKKHIIWSNMDIDFDAWKKDFIAENDADNATDENVWNFINESLNLYIHDERSNLNIKTDGRILIIADIGRWNGRVTGYKILGHNINDILYDNSDYIEWYSDGYNIRATAHHHDGTNHYLYREIREDKNIDNLLNAICTGKEISRGTLNRYTKSINPYVKNTYGW